MIWHEYTREGRTKHWTDFNTKNKENHIIDEQWYEIDRKSKKRLRHMLQEENNHMDLGQYGLGSVRSHKDYELYAGINFENKKLHPETIKGTNPPTRDNTPWWSLEIKVYVLNLKLPPIQETYTGLYIGIEDEQNNVLHRIDLKEYRESVKVEFQATNKPHKYVYWPYHETEGWKTRIDIPI